VLKKPFLILAFIAALSASCLGADYGKVTTHKVADGVYLFTTTPYADVGFCGNSVAVITGDGVLLFDSAATPETAQTILAEIRKLTDKPVRYLVNSHWHWDHWGGNQVFLEANPGLQIICHEKNLEMMRDVEPRWNGHGLKEDLPGFLDQFEKQIAAIKAKGASEERIKAAEQRLTVDRNFLKQKQTLQKTLPNVTFSDALTLHLGGREIQVLHARAITPGDTYIFLPREKILITGDILLDPYPYAIGGTYPAEWIGTLKHFAALKPAWIIPGHGAAQKGEKFLNNTLRMFEETLLRVKDGKAKGMTAEQTAEGLGKQSAELAAMVGVPADGAEQFQGYFLDVFVKRAYRELDAPLGDLPDGLPPGD
jgi:glyoxylase-like metal-dependent hydrolase (beta-lactamase superfamily II)